MSPVAPRLSDDEVRVIAARLRNGEQIVTVAYEAGMTSYGLRNRVRAFLANHPDEPPVFRNRGPGRGAFDNEREQLSPGRDRRDRRD